ncbi:hypothetical protein SAMN02982996_03184 [Lonsdalea quercina]|uniref:Uncharacterized protein n=1 Tax=Lonsdalea quercina TaxID=71657 RepID=A0A1H4FPJ4_9GAMM|nr:hypothetical protein SAMN02982996_03184 [Lonsdalea quercina]
MKHRYIQRWILPIGALTVVMMLTGCEGTRLGLGNMNQKNDICPAKSAQTLDPGKCI